MPFTLMSHWSWAENARPRLKVGLQFGAEFGRFYRTKNIMVSLSPGSVDKPGDNRLE
jgi:hypothetical protein